MGDTGDWYCDECRSYLPPSRVTYAETCDECGNTVVWVRVGATPETINAGIAAVDTITNLEVWLNSSDEKRPRRRMESGVGGPTFMDALRDALSKLENANREEIR